MTKTSCGTLLSAGRGRMTQDTRDTCWPCRTDAACCVPVGPGGKPQIGNCPAPGWKHILLQGRWLADCLRPGELGYTKVFSKGQMTLFTASLGILGIESQWGRYSFHIMQRPCSSLMIFIWMFLTGQYFICYVVKCCVTLVIYSLLEGASAPFIPLRM